MPPPADIDQLSHAELKSLFVALWEQNVELQRTVAALRDEVARLKGGPGRPNIKPNIKPSGMERGTEPKLPGNSGKQKQRRGDTRSKITINEERAVKAATPPHGARFKGYTSYVVQDLVIHPHVVNFQCERWQLPDGLFITAPLPAGIKGHFGPQLRQFVLTQYHQGQTTVPRLVTLLRSLGIFISKRQVVRLLIEEKDDFLTEACDTLAPGFRVPLGSRSMTPVPATRPRMVFARRSAMLTSPGSAQRIRRAVSTFSSCCALAMATTSSMPRRWITCANETFQDR